MLENWVVLQQWGFWAGDQPTGEPSSPCSARSRCQQRKNILQLSLGFPPDWDLDLDSNHTETVQMTSFILPMTPLADYWCSDFSPKRDDGPQPAVAFLRGDDSARLVICCSSEKKNIYLRAVIRPLWSRQTEPSWLHFGELDAHRDQSALLLFLLRTDRLCPCFPPRYRPQRTSPVFRPLRVRPTSKCWKEAGVMSLNIGFNYVYGICVWKV